MQIVLSDSLKEKEGGEAVSAGPGPLAPLQTRPEERGRGRAMAMGTAGLCVRGGGPGPRLHVEGGVPRARSHSALCPHSLLLCVIP